MVLGGTTKKACGAEQLSPVSGVYMYYLNYTPARYPYPGGIHGYIAKWLFQHQWRPSAGEAALMSSMARYWANMARNGTPNTGEVREESSHGQSAS